MNQLHGVETIELTDGAVSVITVKTAVIGLVGTAPDAQPATCATGQTGSVIMDSALTFSAVSPGRAGNALSVVAASGAAGAALAVDVNDAQVSITLATDANGVVTTTAQALAEGLAAVPGLPVTAAPEGAGQGMVAPFTLELRGGEDEPFPFYAPVPVLRGNGAKNALGSTGSLTPALDDIFDQAGALVVVVRVPEATRVETTRANLLDGIRALATSHSVNGYAPRILIATGFSEDDAVGKGLETLAKQLRAVAYVDCASMAKPREVIVRRRMYGSRVEIMRARVEVATASGVLAYRPVSARAAGLRARIDMEKGWWWSKSNQEIYNILGVEQVDNFILNDPNCMANLLNQEEVSTIIRHDGFRHWGNRLCSTHPQLRFEAVRRTMDVIEDSIEEAMMPFVDHPLDKWLADDILGTINGYLRELKALGAIFGGRAWLDEELNTATSLAAGNLWVNYDIGPKSPMEKLTLRVRVNNNYALEEFEIV
ncbi:phage tail sheath subtilisin-like domain-containing protein [Enterobacter roggenkampii]|uniref:phage tail sheath C-terminal domain-containing protein n=1 Tax=Enterobacter roggenkampii TaxID=1812935 RepID=UPI002238C797|nr:phage tail sheath C-terminal domain-containing protein [Enterobacter roggenkampii]MCW5003540.1 phage tail sheath subtilisin-like domain-containing protein [Enterobacter roggenkampii]